MNTILFIVRLMSLGIMLGQSEQSYFIILYLIKVIQQLYLLTPANITINIALFKTPISVQVVILIMSKYFSANILI